ncbi:MAG TPA: NUDIX hydrolase [Pseudolabrys sp.]|nr:NUDIX hydrolase [Pseudolabrys sp.]
MASDWPKIRARRTLKVSPWMNVLERDVQFTDGGDLHTYYAVDQADYVAILARTADGHFPIVHQYRPAIEAFSWELPAGMVEPGEDPAETCRRELAEETGFTARAVHALGVAAPCTARLANSMHSFFVELGEPVTGYVPEPGLTVKLVSASELAELIRTGQFNLQLHIGTILLAAVHGYVDLGRDFASTAGK